MQGLLYRVMLCHVSSSCQMETTLGVNTHQGLADVRAHASLLHYSLGMSQQVAPDNHVASIALRLDYLAAQVLDMVAKKDTGSIFKAPVTDDVVRAMHCLESPSSLRF